MEETELEEGDWQPSDSNLKKKREEEGCTADMEKCTPSHSHFSYPVGI